MSEEMWFDIDQEEMMVVEKYSDAFWGDGLSNKAGFERLVERNRDGKKMCQELEDYLKKRSKLEEDYSKKLSNLQNCFKEREEVGILENTFNMVKMELKTMANSHHEASVSFLQHGDDIKKFTDQQNVKKKQKEDTVEKSQSSKITQLEKTFKMEKSYHKKCADRDTAVTAEKKVGGENPPPPQKELEKVRNKAIKAEEDVQKAETAYKSAAVVLNNNHMIWEKDMVSLCEACQDMDEERIRYLREKVWTCLNVDSKLALDIDNSCENIRVKLEKCAIDEDVQNFIKKATTGSVKPAKYCYKTYRRKNSSSSVGPDSSNTYVDVDTILRRKGSTQTSE